MIVTPQLGAEINQRHMEVMGRIDGLEGRIVGVEGKIEGLDRKIESVQSKLIAHMYAALFVLFGALAAFIKVFG